MKVRMIYEAGRDESVKEFLRISQLIGCVDKSGTSRKKLSADHKIHGSTGSFFVNSEAMMSKNDDKQKQGGITICMQKYRLQER